MTITPEALEASAKWCEMTHERHKRTTSFGVMPSNEFAKIAKQIREVVNALRTGQLVPAQPSGDVVEAVAMGICETLQAQFERFAPEVLDHLDMTPAYWRDTATAAITTYEAASGVAKMREALRAVNDAETPSSWESAVDELIEAARAALGEKP